MWTDLLINGGLATLAFVANAVGVHVSATPIAESDSRKRIFWRRRTWIWTTLALVFVLQVIFVLAQTFQQGASSKTLSDLRSDLGGIKGLLLTAVEVLKRSTPPTLPSTSSSSRTESALVRTSTRHETAVQALTDAVSTPASGPVQQLTAAQVKLIQLSATDLATEIKQDFESAMKKQEDLDRQATRETEDYYTQKGYSKEEAAKIAESMHVGGAWGAHLADTKRDSADEAIEKHKAQIDALVEIGKSDRSPQPSSLSRQLSVIYSNCGRLSSNAVNGVSLCIDTLNQVASAAN